MVCVEIQLAGTAHSIQWDGHTVVVRSCVLWCDKLPFASHPESTRFALRALRSPTPWQARVGYRRRMTRDMIESWVRCSVTASGAYVVFVGSATWSHSFISSPITVTCFPLTWLQADVIKGSKVRLATPERMAMPRKDRPLGGSTNQSVGIVERNEESHPGGRGEPFRVGLAAPTSPAQSIKPRGRENPRLLLRLFAP
jgi:hypothetical protein